MSNLVNGLMFSLSSLADFEDRHWAKKIIDIILASPTNVRPTKMGAFEGDFETVNVDGAVSLLVNENAPKIAHRAGSLILEVNKECGFQIQWDKGSKPSLPFISGHLMFSAISKNPGLLEDFLRLIRELAEEIHPVYGEIRSMATKGWDAPVNLFIRLPDVPAISIYGAEYVSMFGRDRIESAPFLEIERINDGYWLVAQKPITEGVPDDRRARIRAHLGESSFMSDGKWRYLDGCAPTFDLSHIRRSEEA